MILGRAGVLGSVRLAHILWKGRFASVPLALGGGGPEDSLTSTDSLSERDYRLMYGAY